MSHRARWWLPHGSVTPQRISDDMAYTLGVQTYAWPRARVEAMAQAERRYQQAKARYQQAKAARRQARALPLTEPENEL